VNAWSLRVAKLRFQLSDWTIFSAPLRLHCRSFGLSDRSPPEAAPRPPGVPALGDAAGYMMRAMPVQSLLPEVAVVDGFIRYVPLQYRHCFVDLTMGFQAYEGKFSSKTRSTIKRKLKKFQEYSGGVVEWRSYRGPKQLREFHRAARSVSATTYQERLLEAGIPSDDAFVESMLALGAADRVRAYVLFDRGRPVSYLYCPAQEDALIYAYLGYDPEYAKHSVGTVLQWLAFEELFAERRFATFDFTEGESEHKRLFATHELSCANVFFLKRTAWHRLLVGGHRATNHLSRVSGLVARRIGARTLLRRMLRFGFQRP